MKLHSSTRMLSGTFGAALLLACLFSSRSLADVGEREVAVGDTMDMVRKTMGKPPAEGKVQGNAIWIYDAGEVEFSDGRVVSVQLLSAAERKKKADERARAKAAPPPAPAPVQPIPPPVPRSDPQPTPLPAPARVSVVASTQSIGQVSADVSNLPGQFVDASGNTITISGTFAKPKLTSLQIQGYASKGRIPYQITALVMQVRKGADNKATTLTAGAVQVRLLDEAGQMIVNQFVSAGAMCPS